jgi:hypothetical protein
MRPEDIPFKEEEDYEGPGDGATPGPRNVKEERAIEFLRGKAEKQDVQLKGRKREIKRLDTEKISEFLQQKTSHCQSNYKFECCSLHCLRRNRSASEPLLVDLAWKLREVLALENTAAQNEILYALLKDRWCFRLGSNGDYEQGMFRGYAIPEAHDGEVICA